MPEETGAGGDAEGASETGAADVGGRTERYLSLSPFAYKLLFYLGIAAWGGYLFYTSRGWSPKDRHFPTLVLTLLFIAIAAKVVQLVLDEYDLMDFDSDGGMMSAVSDDGEPVSPAAKEKFEWVMSAVILLTAVAVYYLGFMYVLPVMVLGLTYYLTRDPVKAVLTAIVSTIGIFVLFDIVLDIRIFEGIWFK